MNHSSALDAKIGRSMGMRSIILARTAERALDRLRRDNSPEVVVVSASDTAKPSMVARMISDRPKIYMGRKAYNASSPEMLRMMQERFQCDIVLINDEDGLMPPVGEPREMVNIDDTVLYHKMPSVLPQLLPPPQSRHKAPRFEPQNFDKKKKAKRRQQKQGRRRSR